MVELREADIGIKTTELLDPTGDAEVKVAKLAARVNNLDGLMLGVLYNGKPNGDIVLERIVEKISQKFKLGGVVRARKPTVGQGAPSDMLAKLSKCQIVINALGD